MPQEKKQGQCGGREVEERKCGGLRRADKGRTAQEVYPGIDRHALPGGFGLLHHLQRLIKDSFASEPRVYDF